MKLNIDIHAPAGSILLSGPLEIYDVEAARLVLSRELSGRPELVLNLAGLTACDTAGAQLICAARKSAEEQDKRFQIVQPSPAFISCCERLGLDHHRFTNAESTV